MSTRVVRVVTCEQCECSAESVPAYDKPAGWFTVHMVGGHHDYDFCSPRCAAVKFAALAYGDEEATPADFEKLSKKAKP